MSDDHSASRRVDVLAEEAPHLIAPEHDTMQRISMDAALRDLVSARNAVQLARKGYHLSILIALGRGHDYGAIADALDTRPEYIRNIQRKHLENKCECGT